jgi:hypothetical protein
MDGEQVTFADIIVPPRKDVPKGPGPAHPPDALAWVLFAAALGIALFAVWGWLTCRRCRGEDTRPPESMGGSSFYHQGG